MKLSDLQPFCSQDESRASLAAPFPVGDYFVATDGRIIVRVARGSVDDAAEWKPAEGARYPKDIDAIFEGAIKNAQTLAPLPALPLPEADCPACHGRAEVIFQFRYNGDSYDTEADCPVCEGSGNANLRNVRVTLGVSECSLYYLRKIAALPSVGIGNGPDKMSMCMFRCNGVEGVLMPMRRS